MKRARTVLVAILVVCAGCDDAQDADAGAGDDGGAAGLDAGGGDVDAGSAGDDGGAPGDDAGPMSDDAGGGDVDAGPGGALTLPPANGSFDYQLGDAYPPPDGVVVVSRDRTASPAPGVYSICYVNGFQSQPGERDFWLSDNPDLVLRDGDGDPVIDPDWDELILDVTTADKRTRLAAIVGGWIDGCADDGFDAIEIDNLDTYSRSGGLVSQDDAVSFMRLLSDRAHARGLPIAQKNSTEVLDRAAEMATDFAIAEECNRWDECADYMRVYGDQVYVIEYRRGDFTAGCRDFPGLSIVLRDLDLVGPSRGGYVYDGC